MNGTSQGAYDGSAAKSFNITAASVGAAASSHSHSISNVSGLQDALMVKQLVAIIIIAVMYLH